MRSLDFSRYGLGSCAIAAMLAGCGGSSQSTATLPQSSAVRQGGQHGKSGSGDLMYVSAYGGKSYVLSYPQGKLVGTIPETGLGVCSDASGDVYMVVADSIMIYAHGATTPTGTLSLPSEGLGCAVDAINGDLAATLNSQDSVAIFSPPYGEPVTYSLDWIGHYCGYDNDGNLFVDGVTGSGTLGLAKLPAGGSNFSDITLSPSSVYTPGTIQWDGKYLSLEVAALQKQPSHFAIERLSVSGSEATVVGATIFKGIKRVPGASWIYANRVIIPYSVGHIFFPDLGVWRYPQGGKPVAQVKQSAGKEITFSGVTVSLAPH